MSRNTFLYPCRRVWPLTEKQVTTFRLCVPLQQKVALAIWKLASNTDYRSAAHLFGVRHLTTCKCLKAFCSAVEGILCPDVIQTTTANTQKNYEILWKPLSVATMCQSHRLTPSTFVKRITLLFCRRWLMVGDFFWTAFAGLCGSLHDARFLHIGQDTGLVED